VTTLNIYYDFESTVSTAVQQKFFRNVLRRLIDLFLMNCFLQFTKRAEADKLKEIFLKVCSFSVKQLSVCVYLLASLIYPFGRHVEDILLLI